MQPEGPNKSEERLQRYAKQRRAEGGDFSLHPATRQLLQGEVTRQFGTRTKPEQRASTWFGLWRGWFAVGGGLAAVVIATSWFFFKDPGVPGKRMELADAKVGAQIETEATRTAKSAPRPESPKTVADVTLYRSRSETPADGPVAVSRQLDRVMQNEMQLSLNVNTNSVAVAQNAPENRGQVNYFADVSYAVPTNTLNYAYSLTPQSRPQPPASATPTDVMSGAENDSGARRLVVTQPQSGGRPMIAGGAFGEAQVTADAAASVDGANRFNRPQVPQVALRNEADEGKGLPQITESETRSNVGAERSRQTPLDAASLSKQGVAKNADPNLPALAATRPAQQETKAETGVDLSVSAVSTLPGGASASQLFFREDESVFGDQLTQKKARADAAEKLTEPAGAGQQILSRFTVEQQGKSVRVVDFDGSLYEGSIDFTAPPVEAKLKEQLTRDKDSFGAQRENNAFLKAASDSSTEEYSFQVSGSNVTLQQRIVVNGRFMRSTNPAAAALGIGVPGAPVAAPAPSPTRRTATPQTRFAGGDANATNAALGIEGTVQIGPTNVQRFRAVPGGQ